jgi:Na+/proline symporter
MGFGEMLRRLAGWCCLGMVAMFALLGYFFGNIRFAPLAAGFLILSAVFLIELAPEQAKNNGIHPGTDSRIDRTGG